MLLPMAARRFFALCTALLLFAAWALPAHALAGGPDSPLGQLPVDRQPAGPVEITLTGDWHITGEVSLVALDPALAERFGDIPPLRLGEAFSPGAAAVTQPVTIRTNGYRIIVEAGGSLTLEELNPQSSLTVTGSHPQGLFQVRDGGSWFSARSWSAPPARRSSWRPAAITSGATPMGRAIPSRRFPARGIPCGHWSFPPPSPGWSPSGSMTMKAGTTPSRGGISPPCKPGRWST